MKKLLFLVISSFISPLLISMQPDHSNEFIDPYAVAYAHLDSGLLDTPYGKALYGEAEEEYNTMRVITQGIETQGIITTTSAPKELHYMKTRNTTKTASAQTTRFNKRAQKEIPLVSFEDILAPHKIFDMQIAISKLKEKTKEHGKLILKCKCGYPLTVAHYSNFTRHFNNKHSNQIQE